MKYTEKELNSMANAIRFLSADAVQKANSGHPGMPMGMADVAAVLFSGHLRFNPEDPGWADRDRFVLSAGHGSMLLYSVLHLLGYPDFPMEQIQSFRQLGANTAGHPEYGHGAGIETTTGPLGQGIANGVGMALAERILSERFGKGLVDHYTYVIAGDGCLMEGISQEAISLAGHLKLNKLIVLFDDNGITIDGSTDLSCSDNQADRFNASGWSQLHCDGHDPEQIDAALETARNSRRPCIILCKTKIGRGSPNKAGTSSVHGAPLGEEEIALMREKLGWNSPPFEIPAEVQSLWKNTAESHRETYEAWKQRLAKSPHAQEFERIAKGELPEGWNGGLIELKRKAAEERVKQASRKSGQQAIEALAETVPELLGGSADLTGSNLTKSQAQSPLNAKNAGGGYVYYGIREHAMAAAMNGIALHGGLIPYGGTFLVFSDYCRASIRLSALMGIRVIYVMTHDSIGLGEDGPTHQPVEHLTSLRAIPNLRVFRPCDLTETAEAWEAALAHQSGPSLISLSRQNIEAGRLEFESENKSLKGAYVLRESKKTPRAILMASGSEMPLALGAAEKLEAAGVPCNVVSVPCMELFQEQPESYRKTVLAEGAIKVAVEAGLGLSWDRYIGTDGIFIGMESFGASGKAEDLYRHFGITEERIVSEVQKKAGLIENSRPKPTRVRRSDERDPSAARPRIGMKPAEQSTPPLPLSSAADPMFRGGLRGGSK